MIPVFSRDHYNRTAMKIIASIVLFLILPPLSSDAQIFRKKEFTE